MPDMASFIAGIPKAELHLHIEGTLEPELRFDLARRNGLDLPHASAAEMRAGYTFDDLTSFLAVYYEAMSVLLTEQDFCDLAMTYFRKARSQGVVYAEIFFDPQAHTSRGVAFSTVVRGLERARQSAASELGIRVQLIMCFLRDHSAESAMRTLSESLPFKDLIVGVGLDSDERGNPPLKFASVYARAREHGYRLTMHCDVDQDDAVAHIWQAVRDLGVERVDHGVNCLEDDALVEHLVGAGIGLTVCPISNSWVTDGLKAAEIKALLDRAVLATVNSDDPAYFNGYIADNLAAAADAVSLTRDEVVKLVCNAFTIAWIDDADRERYYAEVAAYAATG